MADHTAKGRTSHHLRGSCKNVSPARSNIKNNRTGGDNTTANSSPNRAANGSSAYRTHGITDLRRH